MGNRHFSVVLAGYGIEINLLVTVHWSSKLASDGHRRWRLFNV